MFEFLKENVSVIIAFITGFLGTEIISLISIFLNKRAMRKAAEKVLSNANVNVNELEARYNSLLAEFKEFKNMALEALEKVADSIKPYDELRAEVSAFIATSLSSDLKAQLKYENNLASELEAKNKVRKPETAKTEQVVEEAKTEAEEPKKRVKRLRAKNETKVKESV